MGDHDHKEKHDLGGDHLLYKCKTLKLGIRDILKLKKVVVANIMCLYLTSIVVFLSLKMYLWYFYIISGYMPITITIGSQLYEKNNICSII